MADVAATVYVYGVLPASERGRISGAGVEEAKVDVVEHAGLAALTSRLESEALVAARDVRAHWRVLEEAFQHATVLPLRFGTVLESEAAVRERLLEPNAERLHQMLEAMAGRMQLNLKGQYREEPLLREVVRDSPAVAELRDRLRTSEEGASAYGDRIRLGELVASEVARRRDDDTRLALDTLRPFAVEVQEEEIGQDAAFNLAFLVERDGVDRFSAAVRKLSEEMADRLQLRYVGPLPPFSFADLSAGGV